MNVLKRHIHIAGDMTSGRNTVDQFIAPMSRVRVEEAYPKLPFDPV
jgi:hypothetical protein